MNRSVLNLCRNTDGSVAPTVALSLVGLLVVGGIGFDYARLASMDSELQTAADQAALAAASQLDGETGACARAAQAASNLLTNNTRFGNFDSTNGIKVKVQNEATCDATGRIRFYQKEDKSVVADSDANAKFVEVTVDPRTANYALTPIVAKFSSGPIGASALAGVDSAVCGVVPFFICSPSEPVGNTDELLPVSIAPGTGIKMLEGGDQKGPGNYGFLSVIGRGASNLEEALSSDTLHENCISANDVETEPGQKESVFDGINNRFDMPGTCKSGPCSPSTNERKDFVRQAGSCNWQENPADDTNYQQRRYRPADLTPLTPAKTPEIMGHPRDICHALSATANCPSGLIGDGVWDRDAYFRANHGTLDWRNTPGLGPNVTRYQTYLWEAQDPVTRLTTKASSTAGWSAYGTPQAGVCKPPGIAPNTGGIDRRRLTAAVVNCRAYGKINGRKTIPVAAFIDVFLVEPTKDRQTCDGNKSPCKTQITNRDDIYVEAIGASGTGEGGGIPQITRRRIPHLIE